MLSLVSMNSFIFWMEVVFFSFLTSRVVDPHWFNTDPDPAFFLIADPDPVFNADPDRVPDPGFWWPKIGEKNLQLEIFYVYFFIKNSNLFYP